MRRERAREASTKSVYPRKRAREKQSAVLESCAATDVISRGQRKKGRVRGFPGNPPFFLFPFFSPQPVRDSSKVQRNERKGAWPRVHGSGSLLRFLVLPSLRFALLAPGTASN